MLLALDVGNTQTVVGVFDDTDYGAHLGESDPSTMPGLVEQWRISTIAQRTADEHLLLLQDLLSMINISMLRPSATSIAGIALCSSVPAITGAIREMVATRLDIELVVIEPGVKTGLSILYDNPREVGADRIANAVAANDMYDGPLIVVDLGTATTFDVISQQGEYLGGAIAPGIEIAMDALFAHAAALRRIELVAPRNVIGRSTVESMQSGAIFGNASFVDGMCGRIMNEIGDATVIATGGLASLIAPHAQSIAHVEPWLTLHGLRVVFARNAASNGESTR